MRMVGLILLVIGSFAVVVNILDPLALVSGLSSSPSAEGLLVWGAVAVVGGLLRHYARPKKEQTQKADDGKGPPSQT